MKRRFLYASVLPRRDRLMKIFSICLAVFVLLLLAPVAYGCGCSTLSPEMAFESARTVFIGKMITGTEKNIRDDKEGSQPTLEAGDVTFEIEGLDTFKGSSGFKSIIVTVPSGKGTNCEPYGLVRGEKYFVYAYSTDDDPLFDTRHAGACARIALLTEAKEDIAFIRRLGEIGNGTIKGYVSLNTHLINGPYSLPEISLNIVGPDGTSRTIQLEKNGNYEVTGLRAGTYRLIPQLPADYESTKESEKVVIAGFVIHYPSITAQYRSRVAGTIQDASGVGFDEEALFLENSTTRVPGRSLDQDGRFEIQGVPPGEYLMYMDFRSDNVFETRKYYYPGTYNAELATKIKVGLSELRSGVRFRLPSEFRVRKMSGTVITPDGKPGQAYVTLLPDPTSSKNKGVRPQMFRRVLTDKSGRFSLNALAGFTYWLQVFGQREDGSLVCSTPVKIVITKNRAGIKHVLLNQCTNFFPVPIDKE